jgi:hypothetical protein
MGARDTFTCCETPLPWPEKGEDRGCPECGTIWEHDGVDIGAGARIKASRLTAAELDLIGRARALALASGEYEITDAIGQADDVSYSALIARAFVQAQHLLSELAVLAERVGGEDGTP